LKEASGVRSTLQKAAAGLNFLAAGLVGSRCMKRRAISLVPIGFGEIFSTAIFVFETK
jgi:hypothetical protein